MLSTIFNLVLFLLGITAAGLSGVFGAILLGMAIADTIIDEFKCK